MRNVLGDCWPEARDTYIEHSDQTIKAIAAAVDAGQAAEIARLAHLLAGGSGVMGARQLVRLSWDLERAAREDQRAAWVTLARAIREEFASVRALLDGQDDAMGRQA